MRSLCRHVIVTDAAAYYNIYYYYIHVVVLHKQRHGSLSRGAVINRTAARTTIRDRSILYELSFYIFVFTFRLMTVTNSTRRRFRRFRDSEKCFPLCTRSSSIWTRVFNPKRIFNTYSKTIT